MTAHIPRSLQSAPTAQPSEPVTVTHLTRLHLLLLLQNSSAASCSRTWHAGCCRHGCCIEVATSSNPSPGGGADRRRLTDAEASHVVEAVDVKDQLSPATGCLCSSSSCTTTTTTCRQQLLRAPPGAS